MSKLSKQTSRTSLPDFNVDCNTIFKKKWKKCGTMYFFYFPNSSLMAAITRDDKEDTYYEVSLFVTHYSGRTVAWKEPFYSPDESQAISQGKTMLLDYLDKCNQRIKQAQLSLANEPKDTKKT